MRASIQRRKQEAATQKAPAPPPVQQAAPPPSVPPPVYPIDAALQAIRRSAPRPPYPELMEMKEGPVTKHIRLTSALILRNISRYSAQGRR